MRQGRERIRRSREKTFHRVVVEGCARADDGNLFDYRLRNDEPVKRVTMMKRQCRQRCRMAGLDRQNQKTDLNNARSRNDSNGSFSVITHGLAPSRNGRTGVPIKLTRAWKTSSPLCLVVAMTV